MRSLVLSLVLLAGCVSPEVERQIKIECAVHDGVLRQWDDLTPAQRKQAYEASRDAWHAQHHNVLGEEPSAE